MMRQQNIHIRRSLTPIKVVSTPVKCIPRDLKIQVLPSLCTPRAFGRYARAEAKVEPQITSATDNICIERFWRSAKVERIYLNEYQTINDLTTDVDDYIEFYNHRRFHQTLDYKKPMDVYQESIKLNQNKKKASQDVLYKKF